VYYAMRKSKRFLHWSSGQDLLAVLKPTPLLPHAKMLLVPMLLLLFFFCFFVLKLKDDSWQMVLTVHRIVVFTPAFHLVHIRYMLALKELSYLLAVPFFCALEHQFIHPIPQKRTNNIQMSPRNCPTYFKIPFWTYFVGIHRI